MKALQRQGQAMLCALALLTIFPIPARWFKTPVAARVESDSLLYYPLAGLLIGLMLFISQNLLLVFPLQLTAVLMLLLWILMTGALHLDGLADTADAWLGGHGDREKTLRILKDTYIGVAGVVAIVMLLLIKLLALQAIPADRMLLLCAIPVLSRTALMVLFLTTPYVRESGMAHGLTQKIAVIPAWTVVTAIVVICSYVFALQGMLMLATLAVGFVGLRFLFMQRLAGTTGDTAGAMVEILEALALLALAAV